MRLFRRRYSPLRVTLDLTYACNLRCVHCSATCMARPDDRELTAAELRGLFEQLRECGTRMITLTGGEPLCRPDWLELAAAAARCAQLVLYTNATLVTEADALVLAGCKPYQVEVTVYGVTEATYEAVTRVPGSFGAFRRGLERLRSAGVRVAPKFVMLKENEQEWQAVWDEFGGCEGFRWDVQVSPRLDADRAPCAHRASDERMAALMARAGTDRAAEPDRRAGALPCDLGRRGCVVTAYGDVWPCGLLPRVMGNVRERDFAAIWAGCGFRRARRMTLRKLQACRQCDALAYCRPCWGLNLLEVGDACRPSPESCRMARLKMAAAAQTARTKRQSLGPPQTPADPA
jgi:radical SAM protein with 4Fe4S-binding SPASM domain